MVRYTRSGCLLLLGFALLVASAPRTEAAAISVPGTYSTLQEALDNAYPGDTITVAGGTYNEKIQFPRSGGAGSPIILKAATDPAGPNPAVIDGSGRPGDNIVLIASQSFVKVSGFVVRNNLGVADGSGVRVIGSGSNIEISGNVIHEIRGRNAMGITVYGTETTPVSDLVIDGNEIFDCEPQPSEALVLNGNVTSFEVTNNYVHDVNNIGIDFIGGETDIQPNPSLVARDGLCRGNTVARASENGWAACIYVDGGRDIRIERNVVTGCDEGIEVGAENSGIVASGNIVRDNLIYGNKKVGLLFGGYSSSVGRANGNQFLNNTVFGNDTAGSENGELGIQYAENNIVRNNIFYGTSQNILLSSWQPGGQVGTDLDYNVWFTASGAAAARFIWNATEYTGYAAYQAGTGQDSHSLFADPLLVDPGNGDFHLAVGSPAINAGDPAFSAAAGETDIDGQPRVNGVAVDAGADEGAVCGDGNLETGFGELCDDGNLVDCDGCDSNCTPSATCGNGILCTVLAGEECDDGNQAGGDCCSALCTFEAAGSACDDGAACTADACDGAGLCLGAATPASGCRTPTVAGKGRLVIKDNANDKADSVLFKWTKGAATVFGDFGDPVAGATEYELCVYDTLAPRVLVAARAPSGDTCRSRPCWKALPNRGYRYRDNDRTPDGLQVLTLRAGEDGRARLSAKAKGVNLQLPPLPLDANYQVVGQVRNSEGECWEATFVPQAIRNDSAQFRDASE